MADRTVSRHRLALSFDTRELAGAIGDVATVLPIVVAAAALTELSLAMMLLWFGVFQLVWGLYYGVPVSVEPMKALAALLLAGTITTEEFLLAGLLLGGILAIVGMTRSLDYLSQWIDAAVVRGIQLGVALVLLETGLRLGADDLSLAAVGILVAGVLIVAGYWQLSALGVLAAGGAIAVVAGGLPAPALPGTAGVMLFQPADFTVPTLEAIGAQFAMTIGNAALATSVLLSDYYDRQISPDELSASMGVMNLVAIPFGAFPMCHGSGGVAGKFAFGARTAGANIYLGIGYLLVAFLGIGLVATYPVAMFGVILVMVSLELGRASLTQAEAYPLVLLIGVLGLVVNLGVAFVAGIIVTQLHRRFVDGEEMATERSS